MSEQYLILHKVRGEPSFDCATKIMIGDEEGWITNSGYRAYPHRVFKLTELEGDVGQGYFEAIKLEVPTDWPDHFEVRREGPKISMDLVSMIMESHGKSIKRRL